MTDVILQNSNVQVEEKPDLIYKPKTGFQTDALRSKAKFLFLGGEAGPGKSWFLIYDALFDFSDDPKGKSYYLNPSYVALILRKETTQSEKLKLIAYPLYTHLGFRWNGKDNVFIHPCGSRIYFRSLQYDDSYQDYQGWEIHYLGIDEITQFANEQSVMNLITWLRSYVMNIKARFRATGNPVGPGLDWVKRVWNIQCECPKHNLKNTLFYKNKNEDIVDKDYPNFKLSYEFIACKRKGSYLEEVEKKMGEEGQYEGALAIIHGGIESPMYKALAEGCWEVSKSQFFSEFDRNVHVISKSLVFSNNWNWVWFGGHDYASSPTGDPAAYVLGRVNQNRDLIIEHEWFGWGRDVYEQVNSFKHLSDQANIQYSGKDIFDKDQSGELRSIADQFASESVNFRQVNKNIKTSASIIRSGLFAPIMQRSGAIYIRESCVRLIADLEQLTVDPKEFEMWDSKQRIKLDQKHYHFDVFNAFRVLVCGVYSSEQQEIAPPPMDRRRAEAMRKHQEYKQEVEIDCSNQYA